MPPKKLTKKELKKLEKEEKLKQEQERIEKERIIKEKEEAIKKKLEEEERMQQEIFIKEEIDRLFEEEKELKKSYYLSLSNEKFLALKALKDNIDWDNYTECSDIPNVENISDINTILSELVTMKITKNIDYDNILKHIQLIEDLNKKLETAILEQIISENNSKYNLYLEYLKKGRSLIYQKLEYLTIDYLQNSDLYVENILNNEENKKNDKEDIKTKPLDQNKDIISLYKTNSIILPFFIQPTENTAQRRMKHIDFYNNLITATPPMKLILDKIVIRPLWYEFNPYNNYNNNYEYIIGGVLDIGVYNFKGIIRTQDDYKIKYIKSENELNKRIINLGNETGSSSVSQIFKLSYHIPDYVLITEKEKLKIYIWDFDTKAWSSDYVTDPSFNVDEKTGIKTVSVVMQKIGPIALIQNRNTDFPYRGFKIRSIAPDIIIFDLQTNRLDLSFQIHNEFVTLLDRNEKELSHISNKKMYVYDLITELKRSGILLEPTENDFTLCRLKKKNFNTEKKAISDIALIARFYYIKNAKWNQYGDEKELFFKIKENLEYDKEFLEDHENDWTYLKYWSNKCTVSNLKDSDNTPNFNRNSNYLTHTNFYILLNNYDSISEEVKHKYNDFDNIITCDTLEKMLKIIRPLSFTL